MTLPATRRRAGPDPADELTGAFACYRIYRCRDGRHLAVGALEPKFWEALCRAVGLPDRIGRQWERGPRGQETIAAFERAFADRDRDEWVRALRDVEACVEPVLDVGEALTAGPAAELFAEQACPVRLRDTPASVRRPAPRLGEHTHEVLAEAGYSADQIEGMRQAGAVA
jgi:alpha-methylacyl-CoA racemase